MNEASLRCLACPHCRQALRLEAGSLRCSAGHTFDIARQGYANLLPGGAAAGSADTSAMVAAREAFLGAGHYQPLAETVSHMAARVVAGDASGCVAEVGAGTGYYLATVIESLPGKRGLALDISKYAARRAARVHERIDSVVCDSWQRLPVRSGAIALVLDVFAPRNAEEFARILAPDGALIVVTPQTDHLAEIVGPLGMLTVPDDKDERVRRQLAERFAAVESVRVRHHMLLGRADLHALAGMGPSARHAGTDRVDRLVGEHAGPVGVTLSARVAAYRLRA